MPESHTPGHHQEPLFLRVHVSGLQYALVPHLRSVSLRIVENGLHRDAIRTQFLSRNTLLHTLFNQM